MMKRLLNWESVLAGVLLALLSNAFILYAAHPEVLILAVPLLMWVLVGVGLFRTGLYRRRMRILRHGAFLLTSFLCATILTVPYEIVVLIHMIGKGETKTALFSILVAVLTLAAVFWVGIISVYLTSYQLGVELRLIGIVCGLVPIANLVVLFLILRTVQKELLFEQEKDRLNAKREKDALCQTKYPILLVHGFMFRDLRYFNYWGRVPSELVRNGATVFYGEHQSARPIAESAKELAERIRTIVRETGCDKVNIIAHSKGGLDCRCALHREGVAPLVASLTTVNTPHRGCLFADHLLNIAPEAFKNKVSSAYNTALRCLGDTDPDFIAAAQDLTKEACLRYDAEFTQPDGVFCQSIGSIVNRAQGGAFSLNYSYHLVERFDGRNDGLVGEESFAFGERYQLLTVKGDRGISHGDIIDLNRENIPEFDVREFYVGLVNDLKKRGF